MEENKEFPNFWTGLLILALLFGLQIIISIVMYDMGFIFKAGDPNAAALITILSFGGVFSLLMHYKKIGYADIFLRSPNSLKSIILVLTIPLLLTVGGAVFWISDITNLIILYYPMSEYEYNMFTRLFGGGTISLAHVCVIAPFLEEILFRGIILRSFLHNYSTLNAIFLSALLFGLFHLNIYQLPVAIILGIFSGWLYVRTKSLWSCILCHSLYNTCVTVSWSLSVSSDIADTPLGIEFNSLLVNAAAVTSTLIGLRILARILNSNPVTNR